MSRVARFMRVSGERFRADWQDAFPGAPVPDFPELPRRATAGSAGYDFFCPLDVELNPGETIKIPTGIRALAAREEERAGGEEAERPP